MNDHMETKESSEEGVVNRLNSFVLYDSPYYRVFMTSHHSTAPNSVLLVVSKYNDR